MSDPHSRLTDAVLRLVRVLNHCLPHDQQMPSMKHETPADYVGRVEQHLLGRRFCRKPCTRTS